ncbi:MAG: glycosyltransferase family 4 protein [Verrucomicrobiota bacterium]|nr:glycosyltransferase family 4 protein [Verrucomicrobiota bacterium]
MPADKPAVLIVVENLPVPLDRRVWQESLALREMGYQVIVICPQMKGYLLPEEKLDGIQIYRHPMSEEGNGVLGFFLEYSTALWGETLLAWKAWRRHRFKVIHLCNPPDILFLVAAPFKLFGVKVIFDVHDLWPEMFEAKFDKRGLFYWAVRLAQRITYALSDVVLATNETNRQAAIQNGKKAMADIFMVRTAPKIPNLDLSPDPSLKKGRQYLVGYVGVMGSADGVHYLIRAAAYVVHQLKRDVQFLLLGNGPEYDDLVRLRDELGLQAHVDLPGWAKNEQLFTALKTIDLGVTCDPPNAYNHSCTMNKVLEYMAFGKAQVSFELRESRASALEGAVYVGESTPEALGNAIVELLDDPGKRERMGRFGAERLKNELNWSKSVEELRRAYERALATR